MPDVTGLTRQPHSWTGLGNPQGGLVFTNAFSGSYEQLHEWTSFQSACTSFDLCSSTTWVCVWPLAPVRGRPLLCMRLEKRIVIS